MPLIRKAPSGPTDPGSPDKDAAVAALRAGSTQQRWTAARTLATFPDAASALRLALADEADQRVRETIFTSLARINTAESVDAVLPYLRSDDARLRNSALDALRAMPSAVHLRLEALLRDTDPDVRILACELARDMPSSEASRSLCAVLDTDPSVNVCAAAIETLAEIGSPDDIASLKRCAARFPDQSFLGFSAKSACQRIGSQHRE
jgi:HEAT repeat protein